MTPSRRQFLQSTAALASTAAMPAHAHPFPPFEPLDAPRPWYKTAYRRAVIDMHIPDWDPAFLSKFDPEAYADALVNSKAQSIVCYAMSHVGLFNYPTQVGKTHAAFRDRDVLRQMIDACHHRGIAVQLYVSLIFDRVTADDHPEWRMRTVDGAFQGEGGRHGLLCPTNPGYRDYVHDFMTEMLGRYDVEGVRCDMTFWPWLCYCEHCRGRFADEHGGDLPETVDWLNARWVAFQRSREKWLVEFAKVATDAARAARPSVTVEHQSSTYPLNWMFGVTTALAAQNDFLQGDFYGDRLQGSFVRKLLEGLTPNRPFAYETSVSIELKDHTARKSEAFLESKAAAAIGDHAAFVFIDAIDPVGTVNPLSHERMGRVFEKFLPYYPHLGGNRVADVAIGYSTVSKMDFATSGVSVRSPQASDSHTESAMKTAARLLRSHTLFRVACLDRLQEQLDGLKVLILPQVNMMSDEECQVVRDWVAHGGKLLATGPTSLVAPDGRLRENFVLADVLGVDLAGPPDWKPRPRYVTPTLETEGRLFPEQTRSYPAFCTLPGMDVRAREGAEVWATRTLPWPNDDSSRFASIHSDPPWQPTDMPEVVCNSFGNGRSVYCALPIEKIDILESAYLRIVEDLLPDRSIEIDAPACVEASVFHQPDRNRLVLTLTNFQSELPNLPVEKIEVRIRDRSRRVTRLPDGADIPVRQADAASGGQVSFVVPRLETLWMGAIELPET